MRKFLHLLIRIPTTRPVLHPRPDPNISYSILSFATSSKIFLWFAVVLARQLEFENAKDSICLFSKSVDGDCFVVIISDPLICFHTGEGLETCCTYSYSVPGHVWRSRDFLDRVHRCHARKRAIGGARFAQVRLWIRNGSLCQTSKGRGVLQRFPLREMEAIEYCQWWWGFDLVKVGVCDAQQKFKESLTIWIEAQKPVLFLLVRWDVAAQLRP